MVAVESLCNNTTETVDSGLRSEEKQVISVNWIGFNGSICASKNGC